jgi:hypothetical protein
MKNVQLFYETWSSIFPNRSLTADEIDKNRQLPTAEIIFAQSEKPLKNNASIFAPKITSVKYGTANIDKGRLSETDKHRD